MASYSFDTSAFVDPWRRYYPRDISVFKPIWERIDALIDDGTIVATEFVKVELERKDDEVLEYVKSKQNLIIPLDDEQQDHVAEIVNRFPNWINPHSQRNKADPFVMALARSMGLTVVTYEKNGGESNVKIPYACAQFDVPCLHYLDFLRKLKLA